MLTDYKATLKDLARGLPKIEVRPVRPVRHNEKPLKNNELMDKDVLSPLNSQCVRPVRTEENHTGLTAPHRFAERPLEGCEPKENQGFQENLTDLTPLTAENGDILIYKRFFEQRKAFHHEAGLSEEKAAWKAANDTAYLFMDNTGTTAWDEEFRDFMDVLYHMYPPLKMVS